MALESLPQIMAQNQNQNAAGVTVDQTFFEAGRDYESINVNHRYTPKEKRVLASYESVDYLPPDSKIYREWIQEQRVSGRKIDWDRWVVMALIGFLVGIVGFFLHQLIALISETKWEYAREYIKKDLLLTYGYLMGYSMVKILH